VLLGDMVSLILWWKYRSKMTDSALPLTLAVFAAGSILVWLLEGKSWFYHRLPASIFTTLALLYWVSALPRSEIGRRAASFGAIFALVALLWIGLAAFSRWRGEIEIAIGSRPTTERRLEELVRSERTRSYIAFSQWIGLGFPIVNNTGVVWSARFDSMWALAGEVWRHRIDGHVPRDWPVHRWVVEDFLAGCPDLAVVDEREGIDYVGTLASFDTRFKAAWSKYRQIAGFDGLRVFRRQALEPSTIGDPQCIRTRPPRLP
jgi:drug/metabolite transporter superfamily protein YnfA